MRTAGVAALFAFAPGVAIGAPAAGTVDDPIGLPENPFVVKGTTVGASNAIDRYDCDTGIDESGGEVVYRVEVPGPGKLTAWVEGDGGGVDVDVHVLSSLEVSSGTATGCVARANAITEPAVDAGTYYVVVDTFEGDAQAGEFRLHVTFIGDAWTEHEPYEGVVWRARRYEDLAGGPQVVHEIRVDLANPNVTVEALPSNGCQTVSAIGSAAGAVAGINGGYFNVATCDPVSLLVHDGELLGTNGSNRSAFGLTPGSVPMIQIVGPGDDWPEVDEAHGGAPRLVTAGAPHTSSQDYAAESITSSSFIGPNPRTAAGILPDGRISFFTVDGRRPTAAGMSLPEIAAFSVDELGLADAVNLDGGGSSTAWVAGMTPNGVVNYPSDAGMTELATHGGARAVSGGFFVFSVAKNFAPVITTTPPTTADLDAPAIYDADAYDANPDDVVTFALEGAPDGMAVDAASGEITWEPSGAYPAHVAFTLVASDGAAQTTQAIELDVPGGVETASSAGAGGGPVGSGSGGGDGASGDGDGCSCAVERRGASAPSMALAVLVLAGLGIRRARRRHLGR